MLMLPRPLKKLYQYERNGRMVLGNLESGTLLRVSPLLREFLSICERLNTEEARQHLQSKYPDADLDHFFQRVKLYASHLFADDRKPTGSQIFSLAQWQAQKPRGFTTMTLNMTHGCNLCCDYCFEGIEFRRDTQVMPPDVAVMATNLFIDQLNELPGNIIFTGGEPLLCYQTIIDVVRAVQRRKVPLAFSIKTNATLLTPEIQQYLVEAGFTFQVSIDGPEAVHNRHRKDAARRGSYDRMMQGLRSLLADVPKRVNLHGTVTHETIRSIGESFDFLHSLGAQSVAIKPVMGNVSTMTLDLDDRDAYAREIFRQAQRTAMRGQSPDYGSLLQTDGICGIGLWHITVDVDGTLYPCYRLSGIKAYRMGHIDQGLAAVVAPTKLIDLYNWEDPEHCGICTWRMLCSRGCYSERLLAPQESPCDRLERMVGERIMSFNFQSDEALDMLPVL